MGATGLLAGAWWRDGRRRWFATAALLALLVVSSMAVAGLFRGIDVAMQSRIEDLYTDDARLTKERPGVSQSAIWQGDAYNASVAQLVAAGADPVPRFESQFILSRRSLVEAYLEEDDQFNVGVPGASDANRNQYVFGLLVGLPAGARTWEQMEGYLVSGRLPNAGAQTMELAMGLRRLETLVPESERAQMRAWPPTPDDLALLSFEVTAGVVRNDTTFKDVVRERARVVGVFDTRIDLVDGFSTWTDQAAAARLSGLAMPVANAFTITTTEVPQGYVAQGPKEFSAMYVGDLLVLVRVLAQAAVGLLLAAPLFLVWNNLQQVLDRSRRELVVCRAIGIRGPIPAALLVLASRATAWGLGFAAVAVAGLALFLPGVLESWSALPVPATFRVDVGAAVILALLVMVGTLGAVLAAWRAHARQDLASTLRTA